MASAGKICSATVTQASTQLVLESLIRAGFAFSSSEESSIFSHTEDSAYLSLGKYISAAKQNIESRGERYLGEQILTRCYIFYYSPLKLSVNCNNTFPNS